MSERPKVKEFPDIGNKLGAPTKKSVFERHKAEAEAKRQREEEETAAVYQDFVKSFDDDAAPSGPKKAPASRDGGFGSGPRGGGMSGAPSRRHFSGIPGPAGRSKNSGPGSLGQAPSSLSRNREQDTSASTRKEGLFAFEDVTGPADPKFALQHSDDEDLDDHGAGQERAVPKPTLRLSSLPPGTSSAALKAIIPANLTVEGLRILPPSRTTGTDRASASAVITVAKDTPALEIDTAVSALQNRYMGRGFYLSISRHLSSTANIDTSLGPSSSSSSFLPFNARSIAPTHGRGSGFGPHRGGYAPPSSYTAAQGQYGRAGQVQVTVTPPSDLTQLKLIHKTLESLLTHGPEFEALLMSRKAVQMEEKWAWLWDSRSVGGVYYRWRLWDILTGFSRDERRRRGGRGYNSALHPQQVFENGALWAAPEQKLPFEYTTEISEIVFDSDYNSSEDDDSGDEGRRRYAHFHGGAPPPDNSGPGGSGDAEGPTYLNPMQKAKLTHLLARLPTTTAKLRRGDVARVTAFAIQHAGAGADETVAMITANVHQPFAYTSANPSHTPQQQAAPAPGNTQSSTEDTSSAILVSLHIISDILSTSSTSGVRHAWRYRSLFEQSLKQYHTFAHLGRLPQLQNWGRLRQEKWKRSVGNVLTLWEGWCVFPGETQEGLSRAFEEAGAALSKKEEEEEEAARERERRTTKMKKIGGSNIAEGGNRWRTVDASDPVGMSSPMDIDSTVPDGRNAADVADEDEDVDGESMPMDEDDDDENDEDIDGVPMSPSSSSSSTYRAHLDNGDAAAPSNAPEAQRESEGIAAAATAAAAAGDRRAKLAASIAAKLGKTQTSPPPPPAPPQAMEDAKSKTPRKRMRAEDMFADDDSDEE